MKNILTNPAHFLDKYVVTAVAFWITCIGAVLAFSIMLANVCH